MGEVTQNWCNGVRWIAGQPQGHYESWFVRANHPTRPLAFWIRYTIFSPAVKPGDLASAEGELWAVFFDGEAGSNQALQRTYRPQECAFEPATLGVQVGPAQLGPTSLSGMLDDPDLQRSISWDLRYSSPTRPLLTLDRALYDGPFPKAKALVASPLACFVGDLHVNGEHWPIDSWVGSQNHNWGERHTERYAWGQVAGFDDDPNAFLEVATAQVKLGPLLTPPLTVLVLRLGDEEYALNTLSRAMRSQGSYDFFQWHFRAANNRVQVTGSIAAAAADFAVLPYRNPPGGIKTCLNSKIARCNLTVRRPGRSLQTLSTRARAAFEILTGTQEHGQYPSV